MVRFILQKMQGNILQGNCFHLEYACYACKSLHKTHTHIKNRTPNVRPFDTGRKLKTKLMRFTSPHHAPRTDRRPGDTHNINMWPTADTRDMYKLPNKGKSQTKCLYSTRYFCPILQGTSAKKVRWKVLFYLSINFTALTFLWDFIFAFWPKDFFVSYIN